MLKLLLFRKITLLQYKRQGVLSVAQTTLCVCLSRMLLLEDAIDSQTGKTGGLSPVKE